MEQANFQLRWGDSLSVNVGTGGGGVQGREQIIQVAERYARTWRLRLMLNVNRPLVVGESVIAQYQISEGVGSATARWTHTQTMPIAGDTVVGPETFDLATVTCTVVVQFLNSSVLTPISAVAQGWLAPQIPVYPLGGRNG